LILDYPAVNKHSDCDFMITLPELAAEALGSFLASDMKDRFGASYVHLAEVVPFAARLALECIGNSLSNPPAPGVALAHAHIQREEHHESTYHTHDDKHRIARCRPDMCLASDGTRPTVFARRPMEGDQRC
jgi:hypothetical protein